MVDNVEMQRSLLLVMAAVSLAGAQPGDVWAPLKLLVGDWKGEGAGEPGKGEGAFSFRFELGGKVLVRKSYTAFPAQAGRLANRHDDLLVVYAEDGLRAIYWDSEGHVIRYRVTASGDTVTFLSDVSPSAPHFRLSYRATGKDTVFVRFEIAPPGKPEAFGTHLEGTSRRAGGQSGKRGR